MLTTRERPGRPSWRARAAWAALAGVAVSLVPGAVFTPADAVGSLAASPSSIVVAAGEPLAVTFTTDAVDGSPLYSVTPPLPAGLTLVPADDFRSAQILGSPATPMPPTVFTVTALDPSPDPANPALPASTSASADVTIRIDGHLAAVGSPATGTVNPPITPPLTMSSPDLAGPWAFTTDPDLPAGLSLGADGTLAGHAVTPAPLTTYTVTATTSDGAQATTSIGVRIGGGALPSSTATIAGELGSPVTGVTFGDPAWPGMHYALTPAPPAGLAIDPAGSLSWTPAAPLPPTTFTVTAYDATDAAIASTTLRIRVSTVSPLTQEIRGIVGQAITPTSPLTAAGLSDGVTYTATLPPGLVIHPTIGRITGRPTGLWRTSEVVITATDSTSATATARLTVTVDPAQLLPPTILAVQAGSTAGALRVLFSGSANAPTGQSYAAELYDPSGTTLLKTVRPFSALTDITGLSPATTYTVVIIADPLPGYVGSRSTSRSGLSAPSGERLAPPQIISVSGGPSSGSLIVTFTAPPGSPSGQTYTAQAFSEDQTTLVISRSGSSSPITLAGLSPGSRYYVVVVADASPGFLESPSRGRFAVASGPLPVATGASTAAGARPVLAAAAAVRLAAGWFALPKSASASALRIRARGIPALTAAKAPVVRIPVNKAIVLRIKRPRSNRVTGVDLRGGRSWVALGPLLAQSTRTVDLPVLRATAAGTFVMRLRSTTGISTYLKVMVIRL